MEIICEIMMIFLSLSYWIRTVALTLSSVRNQQNEAILRLVLLSEMKSEVVYCLYKSSNGE